LRKEKQVVGILGTPYIISGRNHQVGLFIFMSHRKPLIERMDRQSGREFKTPETGTQKEE